MNCARRLAATPLPLIPPRSPLTHTTAPGPSSARPSFCIRRPPQQVSAILRMADRERIPIVPRGAATGLAGGAVPIEGSICLNLARMNRILSISAPDSIVDDAARRGHRRPAKSR